MRSTLDVHQLLQRMKLHPFFKQYLQGVEMVEWGAKTIPEGGYYALPQRKSGDGLVMVGGPEEDVQAIGDILDTIGKAVAHLGGSGMGATMRGSAQYYGHRPDAEGARRYRMGFDGERDEIGKDEPASRTPTGFASPGPTGPSGCGT